MQVAKSYEEQIKAPAPLLCPDGAGGTFLIIEADDVCPKCGELAKCRKMFAWKETKKDMDPEEIATYGYGGVVQLLYEVCTVCEYAMS